MINTLILYLRDSTLLEFQKRLSISGDHDLNKMCIEQHGKFGKGSYQQYCNRKQEDSPPAALASKLGLASDER